MLVVVVVVDTIKKSSRLILVGDREVEAEVLLVRLRGVEARQMCQGVLLVVVLRITREGDRHGALRMGEVGVQRALGR